MKKIVLHLTSLLAALMLITGIVSASDTTKAQAATTARMQVFESMISSVGMTPAAACGVMANIYRESKFQSSAVNSASGAVGLCQWTSTRTRNLKNYCASLGVSYLSMEGQLAFIKYELENNSYYYNYVYKKIMALGNTSSDAYTAARIWSIYYEGSSYSYYLNAASSLAQSYYESIALAFKPGKVTAVDAVGGAGLSWPTYGIGKIVIYRSTKADTGFKKKATVDVSEGYYLDTTAKVGRTYYYKIVPKTSTWAFSDEVTEVVRKANLEDVEASFSLGKSSYTYTGSKIKPKVTIYYGDTLLVKGTDYTVSYGANDNAGTGSVTVKGQGNYAGSVKITFKIKKSLWSYAPKDKTIRLSKGTLKLKPPSGATVTITVENTKIASVKKSEKNTLKLKRAGTTQVTVTMAASKNHKKTTVTFMLTLVE